MSLGLWKCHCRWCILSWHMPTYFYPLRPSFWSADYIIIKCSTKIIEVISGNTLVIEEKGTTTVLASLARGSARSLKSSGCFKQETLQRMKKRPNNAIETPSQCFYLTLAVMAGPLKCNPKMNTCLFTLSESQGHFILWVQFFLKRFFFLSFITWVATVPFGYTFNFPLFVQKMSPLLCF